MNTKKKIVHICSTPVLAIALIAITAPSSNAASASAAVRMQVITSIISKTTRHPERVPGSMETCNETYVSVYIGESSSVKLINKNSPQCTNIVEIPVQEGSIIVIP